METTQDQYQFVDGHWRDVWNGVDDTEPFPDFFDNGDTWSSEVLRSCCGWCGCVDVEHLAGAMRSYLLGEWGTYGDTIIHFDDDGLAQTLIALAADAAGFTEHGGNIGGSWVTDAGRGWLALTGPSEMVRSPES